MKTLLIVSSISLLLSLPTTARAAGSASVAPATTEDLDAFDKALDNRHGPGAPKVNAGIGREISKEAKTLKDQVVKNNAGAAHRKNPEDAGRGRNSDAGSPDSTSMVSSISGKRSGQQDNPGKGDAGHPAEGNANGNANGHGNGHGH